MIKLFYFYSKPMKKKSRLSIAGVYDDETKLLRIDVAKCNKKDMFVKQFGKQIAMARTFKHPSVELLVKGESPGRDFVNVCNAIAYPQIGLDYKTL